MYVRGQLLKAQLENSASDLTPVSTGLIYFNTSTNFPKCYNGAAWKTLVDDTTIQTLQNKVFDNTTTLTIKDTLLTLQDDGDATKQAVFQLSGITTGNTRTYTLPDASVTLTGRSEVATVQNKVNDNTNTYTAKDTLFTLQDNGDVTKQAVFELSGITTGNTRTLTVPDASTTLLGRTETATMTNKSATGLIVTDALVVTEVATQSTPSSGFGKIYPKTDSKLYYLDDQGIETQLGGSSGSGSGEINVITNPSAATDTTGWTAGTSHTVTRDTSNSPLSPITSSCFDIAATSTAVESSTSGVYWSTATHPTGLRNRKLKVEFYFTTSASQTWALGVYAGSTRMTLSTDSSGATTLPAGTTGKFTAYFDADSSTAYTIHFTRTAGAGTTHLYMTSAINGPGTQPQGAVVGPWTAFTPVINNTGSKSFTTALGYWRRSGDTMEINVQLDSNATASGSAATTAVTVSMPTGYTIVTAQALNASGFGFEQGIQSAGNFSNLMDIAVASSSTIEMILQGTSRAVSIGDLNVARAVSIDMHAFLPINEWAGAGTVNVAQNDNEFLSDDGSNDVFGPNGSLVPNQAAAVGSSDRTFAFITPPQDSDLYVTELKDGANGTWNLAASQFPYSSGNNAGSTNQYGIQSFWASSTTYTVRFGNQGTKVDISNSSAGTQSWATLFAAGWRFRVRKIKSGAAVGFGEVVPGLSSGLVSSSGLKGKTAGGSVATGYVGETVSQAITTIKTTVSADTFVDSSQTLTLDPGKWRIEYRGWMGLDWVSGTPRVQGALAIRTGSTTVETQAWRVTLTTAFPGLYMPAQLTAEVDISAQTVYKMSVVCEQAAGTATATLGNNASAFSGTNVVANSKMVATRIA
jgi:hypothetical protein